MKKHRIALLALLVACVVAGLYAFGLRDTAAATPNVAESAAPTAPGTQPATEAPPGSAQQPTGTPLSSRTALAASGASRVFPTIPRGVNYVPLAEQPLPTEWKAHMEASLKNLRETGSFNRGQVKHEFALLGPMSDNLQKKGLKKLHEQLAVEATDLGALLGPSYVLVGADSQGTWVEKRGALGFFQIVRNVSGNQMLELSENQLDVLSGDGVMIPTEYQNDRVGDLPATLERLVDAQGAVLHNLQWAVKNRTFHLTAKNMEAAEIRQVAAAITQRFTALPNGGWRQPYEYDPDNVAHRLARPEPKDKGRW